ncbi:MAG TPA: DUF1614 domain-containing protein [Gammaproteobacteria bacterium]|jgi:uncharacterized membrane protein|nr:DUF1614 domain-containing protein [Gammaproteobacteria bacterium]
MLFSPLHFVFLLFVLGLLMALAQFGLMTLTFHKLGLSTESGFLLLFSSLVGSVINLPLFTVRTETAAYPIPPIFPGLGSRMKLPFTGKTLIAVNVGGGLIPIGFSLYLFKQSALGIAQVVPAIAWVAALSYLLSRPIPGVGVAMPIFVAPVAAALAAILLGGEESPALAYISGSLGVLIGADLLRLRDIPRLGAPIASIGGAGTFDGIFITGLLAVLLS